MHDEDSENGFSRYKGAKEGMAFSVDAVERLEQVGRLISQPHGFERGQLVKARALAPANIPGPCVILELVDPPIRMDTGRGIDALCDIRLGAACAHGHVHPLLAESWMFEPYTGLVIFGSTLTKPPAGIV